MNRLVKGTILVVAVVALFYNYFLASRMRTSKKFSLLPIKDNGGGDRTDGAVPPVVIIFDGLGGSLQELNDIYLLGIPVTVGIVPDLKFSRNVAYIARRCGFDVLIHVGEDESVSHHRDRKMFRLKPSLSRGRIEGVMRYVLNYVRIAKGVIVYPEFKAEDEVTNIVSAYLKRGDFIFVDGRERGDKALVEKIRENGVRYVPVEAVVSGKESVDIGREIGSFFQKAKREGGAVILFYPHRAVINALKKLLPLWKDKVNFVTLEDYLNNNSP